MYTEFFLWRVFMGRRVYASLFCALIVVSAVGAGAQCARPVLADQKKDVETIQKLEKAWSLAYLSGDTEFETCLLTADFMEIRSNGQIHHLDDELALAKKNKGKAATNVDLPASEVHIHGDVAVAYGVSPERVVDGKKQRSYFVDYYVWENGGWHAYFAQQTVFSTAS
jgi:hypothetical protein